MAGWEDHLTTYLRSVFSQETTIKQVIGVLMNLGVDSTQDLIYVAADDLAGALKPIEIRKVLTCINLRLEDDSSSLSTSHCEELSTLDDSCFSDSEDSASQRGPASHARSSASSSLPSSASTTESVGSGCSPLGENNWHYSFNIPWNKIPSTTKKLLEDGKRPSDSQRREVVRVLVAEILAVCNKPGKRHITEIARKMVLQYPTSFRDVIEGQVVGTGYDSLTKQFISRIDNYRRLQAKPARKRLPEDASPTDAKKTKDAYGCVNSDPVLPPGETKQMQKEKQEELLKMFMHKDKDAKKIERLMVETFPSQRRDIMSGPKDTEEILKDWPFLFQEN
ncbi:hypothetical protein N1851_029255 [Merluccius polli]|uniref:Uncharacterized protein n=1 Tax=Merluccius polli TaxID=89951 RepID=A0AA47M7G1_MERPO|nr:hypothetical protein N1851_029255 [Merluccius polli]